MKFKVFSDIEGRKLSSYICTNCDNDMDNQKTCTCLTDNDEKIIICGDIIDSVTSGAEINDDQIQLRNNRKYNLQNLIEIHNNDNIELIIGNRDLNKVKLCVLGKLKQTSTLTIAFNEGSILFKSYSQLCIEIKDDMWEENLNDWPLFWITKDTDTDTIKNSSYYMHSSNNQIFLNRYNDIFKDSMSANELINTIPLELNIDTTDQDYKAFIVFVVFNSILFPVDNTFKYSNIDNKSAISALNFRGLLYNILIKQGKTFLYKFVKANSTEYFFSHGGITENFMKDPNILIKYYNSLLTKKRGILTRYQFIGDSETNTNIASHHNNIFNKIIKNVFVNSSSSLIIKQISKISIQFLLLMSAGYDCAVGKHNSRFDTFFKCDDNLLHTKLMPILSGILGMQNDNVSFSNSNSTSDTTFNIFGHTPIGVSPIMKVLNNQMTHSSSSGSEKNIILMNLDNSNTFLNMNLNISSKSYLEINDDIVTIKSTIVMNLNNLDLILFDDHTYDSIKDTVFNKRLQFYISKSLFPTNLSLNSNLRIYFAEENINISQYIDYIRETFNLTNIFWHGFIDSLFINNVNINLSESKYGAFTVTTQEKGVPDSFKKKFYILNFNEIPLFLSK